MNQKIAQFVGVPQVLKRGKIVWFYKHEPFSHGFSGKSSFSQGVVCVIICFYYRKFPFRFAHRIYKFQNMRPLVFLRLFRMSFMPGMFRSARFVRGARMRVLMDHMFFVLAHDKMRFYVSKHGYKKKNKSENEKNN